jgi:hypothetical protein
VKKFILLFLACAIPVTACTPKEGIEIRDAWTRSAARGGNGAVYFTVVNYDGDDELVGASVEFAQAVEIHESRLVNDVMEMRMLESVSLPTGKRIEFAPGGLHIMLVNLTRDLEIGETIEVTLHFKNHADILVKMIVQAGPDHSDHDD